MRRAARRDANEPEIITALEQLGFAVERVSSPGIPDLLMSRAGQWYVAECKTDGGTPTPAQIATRKRARATIPTFRSIEDVVAWSAQV